MFLTQKEFYKLSNQLGGGTHWKNVQDRWDYHNKAISILKKNNVNENSNILEIGTMGVQLVHNSDVLDIQTSKWNHKGKNPTFLHDATQIPWPVTKTYDWVIAMRVLQHLPKHQKLIFNEMKRIANNILIVIPETYKKGKGITAEEFKKINDGIDADNVISTKFGNLFYWTNVQ